MTEFIINDGVIKFNLNAVVTITPIPPVGDWVLGTGIWNDSAFWDDNAIWND